MFHAEKSITSQDINFWFIARSVQNCLFLSTQDYFKTDCRFCLTKSQFISGLLNLKLVAGYGSNTFMTSGTCIRQDLKLRLCVTDVKKSLR